MLLASSQVPLLSQTPSVIWIVCTSVCACFAVIAFCIAIVLWNNHKKTQPGAHNVHTSASQWRKKIEAIRVRYHSNDISDDEAYQMLASVARDFASTRLGTDISGHTLTDLRALPRPSHRAQGIDLLRQTIAALYPPEFADSQTHALAREVTVDLAAGWVANLVERWRA